MILTITIRRSRFHAEDYVQTTSDDKTINEIRSATTIIVRDERRAEKQPVLVRLSDVTPKRQ